MARVVSHVARLSVVFLALATVMAVGVPAASAGDNDLVLSRFATLQDGGGAAVGNGEDFRSLASELGVVLAPRLLSPSDTLGFAGFQFSGDVSFTTISSDEDFWRARESTDSPEGGGSHGGSLMTTLGIFVRKGIWLPLPSFEIGGGMIHLLDSDLFAAQGYAKFALHEGYHDLPIPSVAVRGAVSRMMGTTQVDLTVASVDVSLSKAFGIGGSINLEPYGGWNALFIIPRSEVIDPTPNADMDVDQNFVFRDQDRIDRHRFFAGFKLQYYVFALLFEANITLKGRSTDNQPGTEMDCGDVGAMTSVCDSTDQSGLQQTYTVGIGMDF